MGKICRRNSLFFFAGLLALCAVAVITNALLSKEWVYCKLRRSLLNTTHKPYDAGWKKFGLFEGCKETRPQLISSVRDDCFKGRISIRYIYIYKILQDLECIMYKLLMYKMHSL